MTPIREQQVAVASLKKHPRQHDFFPVATEAELDELAADLESRGQQEPIHCTADGTLIRGHRRVECAKRLGWETIRAIVHDEITDAMAPEVVNDLISDNLMRQQLDDLALARCYHHLKQTSSQDDGDGDVRDRLAARLNCGKSGRTLDRLERLLDLPREIQDAISRGDLTKSHGEKILRLPHDSQAEIEQRLGDGEVPQTVLQNFGLTRTSSKRTPVEVGNNLLMFFQTHLGDLREHQDQLDGLQIRGGDVIDLLERSIDFLTSWRDRKRSLRIEPMETQDFKKVGFRDPDSLSGDGR